MKQKVIETIKKYNLIEKGDKIVIGVSGGPDSITLLNILKELKENNELDIKFDIYVAHINHLIRKEATSDEEYVKKYCQNNNIECFIKRVKVEEIAKQEKIGTEEAGRNTRYKFFNEILKKTNSNKVAIAHNKNDNAETILMNLLRGSGSKGLKGIEVKRDNIIRPLIECNRLEIEEYCEKNNLKPRIDRTNKENIYTRNKIRNLLIPYIEKEFNPNIIETLDRLSKVIKEENDYLEKIVKETYKEILVQESEKSKQIILDLKKFNNLEKVIKNRIVLYTINKLFGNNKGIEKKHIDDIIKLCSNNIGNKYLIPNKKIKILVKNKKIFYISNL